MIPHPVWLVNAENFAVRQEIGGRTENINTNQPRERTRMKILLTGFEPFGGDAVNPSWEAVSRLAPVIGGCEIVTRRMPV